MSADSFNFLACQDLHPEFYFSGNEIDQLEKADINNFREEVDRHNFIPSFHAPFFDLNIGARDSQISVLSLQRIVWALETAAMLKANTLVIHPGYGPWILGHRFKVWLKRAERCLRYLVEQAKALNIRLAFENIYDSTPDDLKCLIDFLGDSNVGICLDIGHFNVFQKQSLEQWLDLLGPHIFELHLHDNDGTADQHLALGDGQIDYSVIRSWFNSLAYEQKPILTLELPHRTHVIKSVKILKQWIR
jgi:sugar phosphate isomerase/epimerase